MTDQKLCDRFTKENGKRGKPARDAVCAVCETVWSEHFAESAPERGAMRLVLHPERVREIPEPKRQRRPRAVKAAVHTEAQRVIETTGEVIQPDPEPQQPEPDLMGCGHPVEQLQDDDSCAGCKRVERFWAWSENYMRQQRDAELGRPQTDAEWKEYFDWLCDW